MPNPPARGKTAAAPTKDTTSISPENARIFLLTGAEAEKKNTETQRLVHRAVDTSFADFDVETITGNTATAERVLSAAGTVPLGDGSRVIVLRDTQQMDGEEQKRLAAGLVKIPQSGFLVLHTGTPIIEDGKTRRGTTVEITLVNAVKKVGVVLDFALLRSEDARGWAQGEARRLGKSLAPEAAALFASLPNDDMGRLASEVAKAAAHAGDSPTITVADVEATLSRGADDVIFKLCDAVGARRKQEALGHVSMLFKGGGKPEAVAPRTLVLLARQIRLIAQFRYLGEKRMAGRGAGPVSAMVMGYLPADGAGGILTNPRTSWMADKYIGQARNFSGIELAERLEKILEADLTLKGVLPGGDSPLALMQRLVVELC